MRKQYLVNVTVEAVRQALEKIWDEALDKGIRLGEELYGEAIFVEEYQTYFPLAEEIKAKLRADILKDATAGEEIVN